MITLNIGDVCFNPIITGRGNVIKVNLETIAVNEDGIFADGDCVTGTASVMEAMADERKSAIGKWRERYDW